MFILRWSLRSQDFHCRVTVESSSFPLKHWMTTLWMSIDINQHRSSQLGSICPVSAIWIDFFQTCCQYDTIYVRRYVYKYNNLHIYKQHAYMPSDVAFHDPFKGHGVTCIWWLRLGSKKMQYRQQRIHCCVSCSRWKLQPKHDSASLIVMILALLHYRLYINTTTVYVEYI